MDTQDFQEVKPKEKGSQSEVLGTGPDGVVISSEIEK